MKKQSLEIMFIVLAISGGIARYLNGYTNGTPFNWKTFLASVFVSGFSGYMFALMAISMNLPIPIQFMMAGTGGFFGDQTMKFVLEYVRNKTK